MSYLIDAWVEEGEPRLGLVDARTGVVQQLWQLRKIPASGGCRPAQGSLARVEACTIQPLAKALILMGCLEDISLMQRLQRADAGDICLNCGHSGTVACAAAASLLSRHGR